MEPIWFMVWGAYILWWLVMGVELGRTLGCGRLTAELAAASMAAWAAAWAPLAEVGGPPGLLMFGMPLFIGGPIEFIPMAEFVPGVEWLFEVLKFPYWLPIPMCILFPWLKELE